MPRIPHTRPAKSARVATFRVEVLEARLLLDADLWQSAASVALPSISAAQPVALVQDLGGTTQSENPSVAIPGLIAQPLGPSMVLTGADAPAIGDPGFESPSVGTGAWDDYQYDPTNTPWTYSDTAGVAGNGSGFTSNNPNAPEGTQVGFLQQTGSFSQALDWSAGTYELTFSAAQRVNFQTAPQDFEVQIDGNVVGTFTPSGSSYAQYVTAPFSVTAGSHTIAFLGLASAGGDNTAFVDNVQVSQPQAPTALSDGGFESPSVGTGAWNDFQYDPANTAWTYSGTAGVAGNGSGFTLDNPNAPEGTQVGFLQETGSFSQVIAMSAGTNQISFEAAQRVNYQTAPQNFEVLVDGNVEGTFTPSGSSYVQYVTAPFSVTAGSHTIVFLGLASAGGDNTAFVDNVQVSAPQPPTGLTDGGFESPSVGTGAYDDFQYDPANTPWTYSGTAGVAGNGSGFTLDNPNAPEGTQVGFLQETGSFSQVIAMSAGTDQISFEAAQRVNYQTAPQNFEVLVDGNVVGTFTPSGSSYAQYVTAPFSVTAGSHTIVFLGLASAGGDNTAFVDNVQVNAPTQATAPYTPSEVRHAYGFDQLSEDGSGQTIAIIDAFDDPTIASDLATFDQTYGVPAANLIKATPEGVPAFDSGWSVEISLDVEWAHAIAPGATILLVEAKSTNDTDLLNAVSYAVGQGAKQVSMSWGGGEFSGEKTLDSDFNHPGVTFLASSGDDGAGVEFPAESPYVTGVGGTTLTIDTNSNRMAETAWSGSGGGTSVIEARPPYQVGFQSSSFRDVPDVSYDANPGTGFFVYDSSSGGWFGVGGTSAGAPQWAGLIALVNQGRASLQKASLGTGQTYGTNSVLYSLAGGTSYTNPNGDFYDIVSGSNGHPATQGYDTATGLGSPVANKLVPDLIDS